MATKPIDKMLADLDWTEVRFTRKGDMPFATHEAVLTIGGATFKVYQLNTGQRVFDADDVEKWLGIKP